MSSAKPASLLDYIRCFDIDERHIWHPFTQAKTSDAPLMLERAEAEFLYVKDKYGNEKKIIDGVSSWWVNIHGHSHPYINARIKEQLDKYEHVMFANFTHKAATDFIGKLIPLLPQPIFNAKQRLRKLNRAFFSDNGSTATEVAIKMAVQYFYNQGHYNKNRILAFQESYHGDTIGAMSASGTPQFQQAFKSLKVPMDFARSPSPKLKEAETYTSASEETLAQVNKLLNLHPNKYAAIIIEPMVQGAGGMKFHSADFLRELRLIADRHEVLLIADEVFVGFGRTGQNFACQHAGIVPDLICLSKGITGGYLPMGLTVSTDEIYSAFYDDASNKTFFHGHSYTANPLACAAASASLDLYINENRLGDVSLINRNMHDILDREEFKAHKSILDIRIIGALAVIEFRDQADPHFSQNLQREFLRRHIYLRPLGNVLYFLPPYTISSKSLDYVLNNIVEVISQN